MERKPWSPSISPKQAQVLLDKTRFKLLTGPRYSVKSFSGLNAIALHLWDTPKAHVSMIGVTSTDNADGGAWTLLHNTILPQWFDGGFGMKYVPQKGRKPGPWLDGATHKLIAEVKNKYGGVSRIQLDSLDNEREVEHKFKGRNFSMMYVTEMSNFKQRFTFDTWQECLRGMPIPYEAYSFIGDTNPPAEGEDSWIYKLFFAFRTANWNDDEMLEGYMKENNIGADDKEITRAANMALQRQLSVHQFTIDDNIWMTEDQKLIQRAKYLHNQDLYDRLYLGLYKKATGDGVFADVFKPNIHVRGDNRIIGGEELVPEETCSELGTGWDMGNSNNAGFIIEPCLFPNEKTGDLEYVFKVLDEYVERKVTMGVAEVAEEMLAKIEKWEKLCASKVLWQHVSDAAAFNPKNVGGKDGKGTTEAKEVFAHTGGRIELLAGPKPRVQARVNLLRKLLFNDRLLVDAKCVNLIETLNTIKKGNNMLALDPKSPLKHAFDALTYYICFKCYAEIEREVRAITRPKEDSGSSVVRVNL